MSRIAAPARCSLLVSLLALILGPATVRADDEKPAQGPHAKERAAYVAAQVAFQGRVNAAIDLGVTWLKSRQAKDGTWGPYATPAHAVGLTALCLQTLATCDVNKRDPHIRAGLRVLAKEFSPPLRVAERYGQRAPVITYSAATTVLFYEALYASRKAAGTAVSCRLPRGPRRHVRAVVAWLVASRRATGWRYPYWNAEGKVDLSNTVYALMALQSAARCGVTVDPAVYRQALAYLLREQAENGPAVRRWLSNVAYLPWVPGSPPYVDGGEDRARGWAYLPGSTKVSGSMTSAGVASLAIIRDQLAAAKILDAPTRASIDSAMLSGMAWLGANFDVCSNPGPDGACWRGYHLYGLERAGALAGVSNFGRHDWYREGAETLLAEQQKDGGWPAAAPKVRWSAFQPRAVETCFALLFLKRGTVPPSSPIGESLTPGSRTR